jgi:endoglycosylceramidase
MLRSLFAILLVSIASCTAPPQPLPAVRVRDRRFVDSLGRDRHFRGVNVVYKDPPWLPSAPAFDASLSFVEDDAVYLASLGVNLIRLGVMWPGVVPTKGKVDHAYLERARALIRTAAAQGIYTIVEPHQDEMNPRFCGEGAPDWWVQAHATAADFPVPVQPAPFVPASSGAAPTRAQCDKHSSFSYIWTHDNARAYQTMWTQVMSYIWTHDNALVTLISTPSHQTL